MSSSMLRITLFIAIMAILVQVVTSLFYSNLILTMNNQFNAQRRDTDNSKRLVEKLQQQLSDFESIDHFKSSSPSAQLQPVQKTLNLNE